MAEVKIESSWKEALQQQFGMRYWNELTEFVKRAYATEKVYPKGKDIFKAYQLTPLPKVKVVILGQDPYHGPNQAHGLCFSVNEGVPFPPSLQNIFTERQNDLGLPPPPHGNLSRWAEQGVLLLNTTLTVAEGRPASHQGQGWEIFTDATIRTVSESLEGVVFILWGAPARKKKDLIDLSKHFIIESAHPSPLSVYRGFYGSKPFSRCNDFLKSRGQSPIAW